MADPEKCREPLYTTDSSGERGGMGFAIMESFTDKMKVKTAPGKGTTVTLIKKLS
jgi:stage II sporulation protein AB (anti-sigma F factor)